MAKLARGCGSISAQLGASESARGASLVAGEPVAFEAKKTACWPAVGGSVLSLEIADARLPPPFFSSYWVSRESWSRGRCPRTPPPPCAGLRAAERGFGPLHGASGRCAGLRGPLHGRGFGFWASARGFDTSHPRLLIRFDDALESTNVGRTPTHASRHIQRLTPNSRVLHLPVCIPNK